MRGEGWCNGQPPELVYQTVLPEVPEDRNGRSRRVHCTLVASNCAGSFLGLGAKERSESHGLLSEELKEATPDQRIHIFCCCGTRGAVASG